MNIALPHKNIIFLFSLSWSECRLEIIYYDALKCIYIILMWHVLLLKSLHWIWVQNFSSRLRVLAKIYSWISSHFQKDLLYHFLMEFLYRVLCIKPFGGLERLWVYFCKNIWYKIVTLISKYEMFIYKYELFNKILYWYWIDG